jgi:hypothetical protein
MKKVLCIVFALLFCAVLQAQPRRVALLNNESDAALDNLIVSLAPTFYWDANDPSLVTTDTGTPRVNAISSKVGDITFTQSTDANKPLLSRADNRENLSYSEDFDNATYWTHSNVGVSGNTVTADAGTHVATLYEVAGYRAPLIGGNRYRLYVEAEYVNFQYLLIGDGSDAYWHTSNFDLSNCTVNKAGTYTVSTTATDLGSGKCGLEVVWDHINTTVMATRLGFAVYNDASGPDSQLFAGTEQFKVNKIQVHHASADPTYIPTNGFPQHRGLNGKRALYFDGVNDELTTVSTLDDFVDAGAKTVIQVYRPYVVNTQSWPFRTTTGNYFGHHIRANSNGEVGAANYDGATDTTDIAVSAFDRIVTVTTHDGTNLTTWVGSTSDTTASGDTTSLAMPLILGCASAGTQCMNGEIEKLIFYDRVLPTGVINKIVEGLSK